MMLVVSLREEANQWSLSVTYKVRWPFRPERVWDFQGSLSECLRELESLYLPQHDKEVPQTRQGSATTPRPDTPAPEFRRERNSMSVVEQMPLHYWDVQSGPAPGQYVRVDDLVGWIEKAIGVTQENAAKPEFAENRAALLTSAEAYRALVARLKENAAASA